MADVEASFEFDPTMKKKKKSKKRIPIDLDALDDSAPTPEVQAEPESEPSKDSDPVVDNKALDDDIDLSDNFSLKKKKKKKKKGSPFDMDAVEESLPDGGNNKEEDGENCEAGSSEPKTIMDDFELDFSKRKKKKKSNKRQVEKDENIVIDTMENGAADSDADDGDGTDDIDIGPAWANRDYTYDELLTRVFDIMRAKNPDMVAGEKRKFVMKPPQVVRIGTKKTSFANFTDICRILHRQQKHLLQFLLAELGTSGSVDGNNQLIIKGRFQQKQIENVLRRYIKEYVTCHTCRSPDTMLHKETRLFFLQCETCGSRCSVASIKSGFQAITGKRAALKNKQQ